MDIPRIHPIFQSASRRKAPKSLGQRSTNELTRHKYYQYKELSYFTLIFLSLQSILFLNILPSFLRPDPLFQYNSRFLLLPVLQHVRYKKPPTVYDFLSHPLSPNYVAQVVLLYYLNAQYKSDDPLNLKECKLCRTYLKINSSIIP